MGGGVGGEVGGEGLIASSSRRFLLKATRRFQGFPLSSSESI